MALLTMATLTLAILTLAILTLAILTMTTLTTACARSRRRRWRWRGAEAPGLGAARHCGLAPSLCRPLSLSTRRRHARRAHRCTQPPTPCLAHPMAQLSPPPHCSCPWCMSMCMICTGACTSRPQLFSRRASLKLQLEGCGELKHKPIKHKLEARRGAHVESQPPPRASSALVAVDT